ncbi:MAG: class I cytochrome c [Acidobacteria bacterium]|nr:MAG: class I cytochrome c [Acidobacteriota bacterium]
MKRWTVTLPLLGLAAASALGLALGAQEKPPQQQQASVWDGVYTNEQAKRGEASYLQECSNCHGRELEGADMTPALAGLAFSANWDGLTLGDLFERIRITMPADRPGSLARQQIADILSYVLVVNKFPAGDTELPREVQALRQIFFQTRKPSDK